MKHIVGLENPIYQKTMFLVLGVLFVGGFVNFFLRKTNSYSQQAWELIKGWFFLAPIFFLLMGLRPPIPIIVLTVVAMLGAKTFFQLMGMYQRSSFVLICYSGIIGLGLCSYYENAFLYNLMPMLVLATSCLVPIILRQHQDMIQYISLTLLGFIFLGWSFMHLSLILNLENGLFQALYLILLTEFCDNTNLALGHYFKSFPILPEISSRRTLFSTLISILATLLLSYLMRTIMPDQNEKYWLAAGLISSFVGIFGDLIMSVVRQDAGVRNLNSFTLGKGDFLQQMDRLIFAAPIYYFVMRGFS